MTGRVLHDLASAATPGSFLLALQRTAGNAGVQAFLRAQNSLAVQRHPAGASLSVNENQSAVVSEVTSPRPLAPATGGATDTTVAPATPEAMSLSRAQEVLTASFGSVKTIVPGSIVMLDGRPALWAKYDQISKGRNNALAAPARPWQDGDAERYIPTLEGFADNGTVYVNKNTPLPTATAHEMLHNNTAADYRGRVGETVNEGTTEYLAIKALTAAGVAVGDPAYPDQRMIVGQLIRLVGEDTLIQSYFGGADLLINTYALLKGNLLWYAFRAHAEALRQEETELFTRPPSTQERIDMCNKFMDGWVSDEDLDAIETIYKVSSEADKGAIRAALRPRISDLWSIGQRTRLRVILNTV
jgi:hypothetical protein